MYVDQFKTDDFSPERVSLYSSLSISDAAGLRVSVHPAGTAPDMTFGMSVGASTEMSVLLSQTLRTRLAQPYSNCTDQRRLTGDNTSDAYTLRYCVNTCIQQQIVNRCGCLSSQVKQYSTAQLKLANYQVCENQSSESFTSNANCAGDVMVHFSNDSKSGVSAEAACNAACVLPCQELKYDVTTSVAPWPQAWALPLYCYLALNDSRFSYRFNLTANATQDEQYAKLTAPAGREFFRSRFLKLSVQFDEPTFVELKDVAAFSVDVMGAQIGGVLSLWLGVTVMFAFEAFEFLYVYLTNCRKEEESTAKGQSTSASSVELMSISQAVQTEN